MSIISKLFRSISWPSCSSSWSHRSIQWEAWCPPSWSWPPQNRHWSCSGCCYRTSPGSQWSLHWRAPGPSAVAPSCWSGSCNNCCRSTSAFGGRGGRGCCRRSRTCWGSWTVWFGRRRGRCCFRCRCGLWSWCTELAQLCGNLQYLIFM